ncbi:MAG: Gfo/Idh/MocA family oxidoreductase, partial [Pseudonocardiaceae bacterium]
MTTTSPEVGVAIIGTGTRFRTVYGPLLKMLPGIRLTGVCGRDLARAADAAARANTAAYPDVAALLEDPSVQALVACVS